jgi:hypothetical protein
MILKLDSNDFNVVGDITGYGKTLLALQNQMPKVPFIGLGDIIDRGPNSKMALDFFIDQKFHSVMGNHDHMMLWQKIRDTQKVDKRLYPPDCWAWNGGHATAKSFGMKDLTEFSIDKIEQKYWDFISNMPLRIDLPDFVLTHAPIGMGRAKYIFDLDQINKDTFIMDASVLWNRLGPYHPRREKNTSITRNKIQLYGHNSTKGVLWHTDKHLNGIYRDEYQIEDKPWGICLDTWRHGYLSGLHLPTMKVYKQELID